MSSGRARPRGTENEVEDIVSSFRTILRSTGTREDLFMRKRWKLFAVPVLALMGTPCAGATVTVTSTTDISDGDTSSISALIAAPGPDGVISLREAITAANNTPGADTINFNIAGSGVKTIYLLTSKLPPITEAVTIDGYTQPGTSPNTLAVGDNAVLRIQLSGDPAATGPTFGGLSVTAANCVVQ